MEGFEVKIIPQGIQRPLPLFQDFEHPDLVRGGLSRPGDISPDLLFDGAARHAGVLQHIVHSLIVGPAFDVDAGIHDEACGAESLGLQAPQVAVGIIFVEA